MTDVIREAIGPYTFPAKTEQDELRHRAHAALDALERERDLLKETAGLVGAVFYGRVCAQDDGVYGDWRDDPGNYGE